MKKGKKKAKKAKEYAKKAREYEKKLIRPHPPSVKYVCVFDEDNNNDQSVIQRLRVSKVVLRRKMEVCALQVYCVAFELLLTFSAGQQELIKERRRRRERRRREIRRRKTR